MANNNYKVIGLMSGSSLDGLDIAYCNFEVIDGEITWQLLEKETVKFDPKWTARLAHLPTQSARVLAQTHAYFGRYMAELVNDFIKKNKLTPNLIASHGHTIFHEPERYFTSQIGDGAALAALTGITTVCDFRTQDIALAGEGTPIAPAADRYLFSGYDFYLNIGGIANITCDVNGKYIAFDTSPANQVLNLLANEVDLPFDLNGEIARSGRIVQDLVDELNAVDYFQKKYPKSLDNNWIRQHIFPIIQNNNSEIADKLHTYTRFIVIQVKESIRRIFEQESAALSPDTSKVSDDLGQGSRKSADTFEVSGDKKYRMLATGGGAFNQFLMEQIQAECKSFNVEVVLPEREIIEYKEAILMGLMGVLRMEGLPNCFSSVTGAGMDTVGGAVYVAQASSLHDGIVKS